MFFETHLHINKIARHSLQSEHQVTQSHPQIPKLTPNGSQNNPKVTPICRKCFQCDSKMPPKPPSHAKSDHRVIPKLTQSHHHMRKGDSKVTPKSPSHAKSDAEVTPKWLQSHLHTPKVILKSNKSFKSSFTFFLIIGKSGSLEAPKSRSLEAARCLGGNREAKSILKFQNSVLRDQN